MKFNPHDYQKRAIQFIEQTLECAVFLGLGMGKTIITLTALNNLIYDHFDVRKALIVAPLRVARDTWPAELRKWDHLKHLRMSVIVGSPKKRLEALGTEADIYVINRENIPWLVEHYDHEWPFDMVIIDELSSFKNHQARRSKALQKMRPHIKRIIGLTGTPSPNGLMDLWAQFRLLDGGKRLGRYITHYRNQYFNPDKRNGMQIFSYKLKPGAEQEIYNQIADITLSMKTTDHLTLPDCTYTNHVVHLTPAQIKTYNRFKRNLVLELGDEVIDAANAAALSGKLQQLASGAIYTEEGHTEIHNKKLDALEDIIEAANGQTVLCAIWFKHELERILNRFPQAVHLDTAEDFNKWNRGEIPLALIHPASAGHGLNLQTGGHIMVWFTTPWSLELYEQTNARLFRQGQTEPVSIIHIQAKDTIDEDVHKALGQKHTTQDNLITAVAAQLREDQ